MSAGTKIAKHYKLIQEHPASFELHDERDGRSFHVAKRGMSEHMKSVMGKIQNFSEGGTAQPGDVGTDIPYDTLIPQEQADNAPYGAPAAPPPSQGVQLASNGPVTPDQVASLPGGPTVAGASQSDIAPQPTGDALADIAAQRSGGLDEMERETRAALKAETNAKAGEAGALKQFSEDIEDQKTPEEIAAAHKGADDAAMQAYQSKKIDPDRYWNSRSTGAKISAGIGMILGGLSSGATGGPNLAVETINRAIDRDIEAQKDDQSKAMNLWKMNREATKDDLEANLMTRNQMLTAVEAKTKMFAAQAGGAEAQLKFAPVLLDIQRQKQENYLRMGLMRGGMSETDPSQLVPILVKNPEQQKQVYEEIGKAQNVAINKEKILKAFDDASQENTVMRTGAGYARTPASVMALHQLMLPNFKQIDGTVRQAAMDESFHNLTPSPGDSNSKISTKRQALVDWMTSEASAPIAKGNGLDLSKFRSTSHETAAQPVTQKMNGITYIKVPGGWKRAS